MPQIERALFNLTLKGSYFNSKSASSYSDSNHYSGYFKMLL